MFRITLSSSSPLSLSPRNPITVLSHSRMKGLLQIVLDTRLLRIFLDTPATEYYIATFCIPEETVKDWPTPRLKCQRELSPTPVQNACVHVDLFGRPETELTAMRL